MPTLATAIGCGSCCLLFCPSTSLCSLRCLPFCFRLTLCFFFSSTLCCQLFCNNILCPAKLAERRHFRNFSSAIGTYCQAFIPANLYPTFIDALLTAFDLLNPSGKLRFHLASVEFHIALSNIQIGCIYFAFLFVDLII